MDGIFVEPDSSDHFTALRVGSTPLVFDINLRLVQITQPLYCLDVQAQINTVMGED